MNTAISKQIKLFIKYIDFFQYDNDYMEFRNQIENLRMMLQNFMDTWFAKSLSVSYCSFNPFCFSGVFLIFKSSCLNMFTL